MAPKRWPPEVKARAAADLAAGMTLREVGEKYGMPRSTASALAPTSRRGAVYLHNLVEVNELQAQYLEQLSYSFGALKALADLIMKEPKFAAVHGDKLAVLYGVVFDKTGKIAGAAVAGAGIPPTALPGPGGDDIGADDDPPDAP